MNLPLDISVLDIADYNQLYSIPIPTSAYLTHCNIPTLREMKNVLSVVLVVAAVGALASPVPAVGQVEVSGRYHSGQIERPI